VDEQEKAFKENVTVAASSTITFKAWYSLAILFLTCIVICVINLVYSNHVANQAYQRSQVSIQKAVQAQRNFCALMLTLDGAYIATPPQTQTGKLVASEVHALVANLGCKEG
jgi:hypothetical protein